LAVKEYYFGVPKRDISLVNNRGRKCLTKSTMMDYVVERCNIAPPYADSVDTDRIKQLCHFDKRPGTGVAGRRENFYANAWRLGLFYGFSPHATVQFPLQFVRNDMVFWL